MFCVSEDDSIARHSMCVVCMLTVVIVTQIKIMYDYYYYYYYPISNNPYWRINKLVNYVYT